MGKCALCGLDRIPYEEQSNCDAYRVQCPRCGEYIVTEEALRDLESPQGFVQDHLHLLSAVARHSNRKEPLHIDTRLLRDRPEFEARVLSQCPRGVLQKGDYILRHLADKSPYPGSEVIIDAGGDYSIFYCRNEPELRFHLKSLGERGLVTDVGARANGTLGATLTANGWRHVEELEKPNIESKQAFVAMWFDDQMAAAYAQGIAWIEQDTDFKPLPINRKQFNDKICDQIVAEIRRSRFLIADVTGHRQGVYFEAGFAMGLGLPVIWTCRKDQIDECHFDTRQYNHITWETPEELRKKLKDRILATIGSPH
jgi:nucleoside 2-deoxyribosyltransferase